MNQNYQRELDELLQGLGGRRPSLLLHVCCAPCASYVLDYLRGHFDITLFFYNPNIRPESEYEKRLYWLRKLMAEMDPGKSMELLAPGYDGGAFTAAAAGLENEPEGGSRCTACFRLRLNRTAELATSGGFDFFCSTLTVSPHKDSARINRLGTEEGERSGVRWLPSDFKKRDGYKKSVALSQQYGLYRQNYCGCGMGRVIQ